MKRNKMTRYFLLLILSLFVCCGCGRQQAAQAPSTEPQTKELFAMDTYMTLTAYGEQADEALAEAEQEILRIESLVSIGADDSEISILNETKTAIVSEDTYTLLVRAKECYEKTNGSFDISMFSFMEAWGFPSETYHVLSEQEIVSLQKTRGMDTLLLDETTHRVEFQNPNMKIDLGGIAKGYTSQRIMEIFESYQIEYAVISLGGNVQTLHGKPDGTKWRVAIQSPEEDGAYCGVVQVEDRAVITSGGYERYFEQDGKKYHHILDPETGFPAENGLSSVTIVSQDGTLADALSTALYVMGPEKAISFWRENTASFDMILIDTEGMLFVSEGIADSFTSEYPWEIIKKEE